MKESRKRKKWELIIEKQKASGLSVSGWCKKNEVVRSTYCYWYKKINSKAQETNEMQFAEVTFNQHAEKMENNYPIRIHYRECIIDIAKATTLEELTAVIKALSNIC